MSISWENPIETIETHTGGEPTRVVVGGFPPLAGETLADKNLYLSQKHPQLRKFLVGEPRGHAPMHAAIPLPACHPQADFSLLIVSALGSLEMCGHALIGTITALVENGTLNIADSEKTVQVETLAGLIEVQAHLTSEGRVESVQFRNAPSRLLADHLALEIPGIGSLQLAIAYGGLWYVIVAAEQLGLAIEPANVPRLVWASGRIRRVVNQHLRELIPAPGRPDLIPQLLYITDQANPGADGRNLATSTELGFDRSPCGTGSCARMAMLHQQGRLAVGKSFVHESVVGSRFTGTVLAEAKGPEGTSIVPTIRGSAFITGYHQLVRHPHDPLGEGFFIPTTS